MKNKDFAIVAIAYNRAESLNRLLSSLKTAYYFGDTIDLIISIDYSGIDAVNQLAERFQWPYGEKRIIRHSENLGLKKHVLFCGNLTEEYENICVFEDDLFVSPAFYNYAKQAVEFYKDDDNIAGISLYLHTLNYIGNRPFNHISNDYDAFFMQQAQSWGQIWTKSKWREFIMWYEINKELNLNSLNFPMQISNWPNSSWLKYHMKYLVDNNKYFVYPTTSFTTNFSDTGTHVVNISNRFQVSLNMGQFRRYSFQSFGEREIVYDIFFENKKLSHTLGFKEDELTVDLYNQKNNEKRYLLTSKQLNFEIVKSFGLKLVPHELNVILNIKGNDIFLYNTNLTSSNRKGKHHNLTQFIYDYKIESKRKLMLKAGVYFYFKAFRSRISKLFK